MTSQIKPRILILFILNLLAGSAAAQNLDWNITGAGARAAGFGGAFIGVADDATSVVWNPAGLATLERPELSAVTRIVMDSFEADFTDEHDVHNSPSNDQSHLVFNFTSAAYPLNLGDRKLVLAAAYQRQLDLYTSRSDPRKFESKGGVDTFTPGLGIRLFPVFSVGAAANVWFGSASAKAERLSQPDQTFSGFNMELGILCDFAALSSPVPLKLGASLRTPFELSEERSVNNLTETRTYEMPLMVGFGASYRVGENLTLAADYEMRKYGDSKIIYANGSESPLNPSEEDLNQVRVGAEYLIVSGLGVFPVRVGFQTVPTVFANYDPVTFKPTDQVSGLGFSVGSGYIAERFAVDVAYSMQNYEWDNSPNRLVGTFKSSSSAVTISGIIYF